MEDIKKYYPSVDKLHLKNEKFMHKHPVIPGLSIANALKFMTMPFRKDDAVNCYDLTVTFDELLEQSAVISKAFKELGVKSKDIVTVCMPNFYQAIACFVAANRIGATVTFLNSYSSLDEIQHYLNYFESSIFINYDKNREYNNIIKKNTKVKNIITLDKLELNKKEFSGNLSNFIGYDDRISFSDLKAISEHYKSIYNTMYFGNQDALILFTSGTTGNPKSVVLTNKNILSSGIYMKNSANLSDTRGEKSLICVPFCYPYGFATSTLMSLLCGRQAILAPDLSKDNISYFLSKNPNIIFGSPALLELVKRNVKEDQDLSSVHTFISGGDFLFPSQATSGIEFFKKHNANVVMCNGAGNAETVGANTNAVGQEIRPDTVGRVLNGQDSIIVNPLTLEELPYNEVGLFCVSGKNVFKEYYKQPELTKEAKFIFKGKEYVKTGMIGFLDTDGYLHLTGRESRYYIMSTLNKVYCEHVQTIMSTIDVIDAVAVVEKPNDELLYTGKAYVVLKDGVVPDSETMKYIYDKCDMELEIAETKDKVQLKPYEIPSSIEFVSSLPRNQADKVDYELLKKHAREEYEEEKKHIKILTI